MMASGRTRIIDPAPAGVAPITVVLAMGVEHALGVAVQRLQWSEQMEGFDVTCAAISDDRAVHERRPPVQAGGPPMAFSTSGYRAAAFVSAADCACFVN
jgi:hypothetical protein